MFTKEVCAKPPADADSSKHKMQPMDIIRKQVKDSCTSKNIKRKLPILSWLPIYSKDDFLGDVVAGLTVGLTVIPQGIAYALIAGLPPNYGLYSAFMGSFVYVVFGSCKDITIGPTAVMSILTHEYSHGDPDIANILCLTSGLLILLFGMLNLGFLIAFISKPVIAGFTSAAAVTIFTSQLKALFGLRVSSCGLVDTWVQVISHISETRWQDFVLGLVCIVVLLSMRKMKDLARFKRNPNDAGSQRALKTFVFLASVSRNVLVVVVATAISAALDAHQPFSITGDIEPGLPDVGPPPVTFNNGTETLVDVLSNAGAGLIILPIIAVLENIAIASSFSQGKTIDATQEMLALGLCNIINAFFRSMPTTGSFSRTAVNATSGVRTPAGGIVTGTIVVLALAVLTPYFKFIPKSALAAVIICAVIFMVEYEVVVPVWRARKLDQVVLWVSFLACIFWKLEWGIVLGVVVNLALLLIVEANPKVEIESPLEVEDGNPLYVLVRPRVGLFFLNVDKVRSRVVKAGLKEGRGALPVLVDCSHFSGMDYTASKGMKAMCVDFGRRGQPLLFIDATPGVEGALRALNPSVTVIDQDRLVETLKGFQCIAKAGDSPESNEKRSLIVPSPLPPTSITMA